MSGFAGIVCADGGTPDAKLLDRFAELLVFRGPDATHIWKRPGAGFCFTLLCTGPAPQATSQPCTLDGNVWFLGDVRLDGRDDLRRELDGVGESTEDSATDEELILRVWRQWGEEGLPKLLGDFSFALWDEKAKRLSCVRDLLGARPFFYADSSGTLVFSNTLDVVRLTPGVSGKLDDVFIADFLLDLRPDADRTVFLNARRLPAGHALYYQNTKTSVWRYTALPIEGPLVLKRREEYIEQFGRHLEQAVRDRLACGATGILMSGGLDSTSVAAIARRVQADRGIEGSLHAYTVDYDPLFKDEEGALASVAARHFAIPIEIVPGARCVPFGGWDEPSLRTPEPCCEPFLALHVSYYRRIAAGARVALRGDGGDSILTGRAWPYLVFLWRQRRFDTILRAFGGYILRHGRIPPLRAGIRSRFQRWLGSSEEMSCYPRWLEPSFERDLHLRERWQESQQSANQEERHHPLHPTGYSSLMDTLWSSIFEVEDAAWTGFGVEMRAPFLDQRLLRFLLRIPPVPWCMNKELLREAMRGLLPREIRLRKKTPMLGDPLFLHSRANGWKANLPERPCEPLSAFVNWKVLRATFLSARGSPLWASLPPVALNHWLKGVENNPRFQYIRSEGF